MKKPVEKKTVPPDNKGTFKLFSEILADGERKGIAVSASKHSMDWYRERALGSYRYTDKKTGRTRTLRFNEARFVREFGSDRMRSQFSIGKCFHFYYDPKTKADMPYYDMFPLVFPVGPAKGGFYALNMHYLDYRSRASLMDALMSLTNNKKFDDSTKLRLSYQTLKAAGKYKAFKPAFKHYLYSHVRSRLILIEPEEWQMALWLPSQKFVGASAQTVWADSNRMIRDGK